MKSKILSLLLVVAIFFASCKKDELTETPKDFYSVSNAYVTASDFQTAVNWLYSETRTNFKPEGSGAGFEAFFMGTDMCRNAIEDNWTLNDYSTVTPFNGPGLNQWRMWYKLIADANVIISNIHKAIFNNTQKNELEAEAKFFRAFGYRILVDLFGGVPIDTIVNPSPRRDYVRATSDEVLALCASDLEFAAANLYDVPQSIDGQVNKVTANHLLSEIYISLKKWDKAIAAASAAINNPSMHLMTSRFGVKISEPGDVVSDLFRYGNYNKSEGNTEGVFVLQFQYHNAGSLVTDYGWGGNWMQGFTQSFYTSATLPDGKAAFPNALEGLGGQGIGWLKPTPHASTFVFKSSPGDLRNSQYNIIYDAKVTNTASTYFGKYLVADNLLQPQDTSRNWYPNYLKTTRWNDFLPENYVNGVLQFHVSTNKPVYVFRLAETYLLRAEAYLGKGDVASAANDINVVRARANATPVSPSKVDIDYILDERLRELAFEELRALTLGRLGLRFDRVKRYNTLSAKTIEQKNNLWPIPYSEIEANNRAKIEQNPGYN